MSELRYTLLSDGSSDTALLPILNWILVENGLARPLRPVWADLGRIWLPNRPVLSDKIRACLEYYPSDLLFIHRDAEAQPRETRVEEIERALASLSELPPIVCIIPVRMQEAWLLIDEDAIRWASGNSSYSGALSLPRAAQLEELSNPKELLHDLLKKACDLNRRRLRRYPIHQYAKRVSEYIRDFSALRALPAFRALEDDIRRAIRAHQWDQPQ